MKKLLLIVAGIAFSAGLYAGEEVTLEGTGLCAKCSLKTADSCTNALEVAGKDGETIIYTFTKNLKHADLFCKGKTAGLVVKGTVTEKDGKMILAATSVEKKKS